MLTSLCMAATTVAPPITIELPAAVSVAAWAIAALLGIVVWFQRREVKNNDEAHTELRGDVKKLLEGQGRIEGALGVLTSRRTGDRESR